MIEIKKIKMLLPTYISKIIYEPPKIIEIHVRRINSFIITYPYPFQISFYTISNYHYEAKLVQAPKGLHLASNNC